MALARKPLLDDESEHNDDGIYYDSFPHHTPIPGTTYNVDVRVNGPGIEPDKDERQLKDGLKVYKRRWYILIIYSLFASLQNFVWSTWGPISSSAENVFGWSDTTIAWLNNWGPVSYIVSGLFFPWLLQVKGLRAAVVSSVLIVSLGASMRVFTSESRTATILIHIGQFFNGLGGPIAMGAIPQLSSTWFPANERVTATALGSCINVFGAAISFVVGPLLVSDHSSSNGTAHSSISSPYLEFASFGNSSDNYIQDERDEIMRYMYYSCGVCWIVCLAILVYFPSKPPIPPALSASTEREKYWTGMWSLRKKGAFLIVSFTYGISIGVMNCWTSVLDVNLKQFSVSEKTAGWIGFYAVIGGGVMSLLVGRFADYFTRFMKLFIVALYLLGAGALIVFSLMLIKVIPFSDVLLYITVIVATTVLNAAVPLLFELACELAYPTSEGAANGFLTYLNNIAGLFFLAVFSIPNIGTMWMNWTVIGSTVVCIPLIALLRGRFKRLEIDEQLNPELAADQEIIINDDNSNSMST